MAFYHEDQLIHGQLTTDHGQRVSALRAHSRTTDNGGGICYELTPALPERRTIARGTLIYFRDTTLLWVGSTEGVGENLNDFNDTYSDIVNIAMSGQLIKPGRGR